MENQNTLQGYPQNNFNQPSSKERIPRKGLLIALAVTVIYVASALAGYKLYVEKKNNDLIAANDRISSLETKLNEAEEKLNSDTVTQEKSGADKIGQPRVVFTPDGLFDQKERDELQRKLIAPMVDYEPGLYVAIEIEVITPQKFVIGNGDDKYLVKTIGKEQQGGTGGFLYGSKKNGIDWWVADCGMGPCKFTPEYRAKYPEVVRKAENQ